MVRMEYGLNSEEILNAVTYFTFLEVLEYVVYLTPAEMIYKYLDHKIHAGCRESFPIICIFLFSAL